MHLLPWLRFFRLPNLPTAPGDALAGAALLLMFVFDDGAPGKALAAGVAALFFYLYGLADNDIVGAKADAVAAPDRPIPAGEISLNAAGTVRSCCLLVATAVGWRFHLPPAWWLAVALLMGAIHFYNRTKNKFLMGLCRGLSFLAGGAAVLPPKYSPGANDDGTSLLCGLMVLVGVACCWTAYIAAVTKLSEGEEQASGGLGPSRYLLGLTALSPLLPLMAVPFMPLASPPLPFRLALPVLGCVWTFATWYAAVGPLGEPHDSSARRAAVGRTIGAILYLQLGFILLTPINSLLLSAAVLWFASRCIRRFAPAIRGS